MITVTLKDILDSQEAMRKLVDKPLKGRAAFQVARLIKKLESELSIYNDTRVKLIEQYAKRKEDGTFDVNEKNEYQFTQENMQAYVEEFNKLLNEEIEIESSPLNLDNFDDIVFTPMEMAALEPFIEE